MPTYTFQNTETEDIFDKFMSISDRDLFIEDNPHIKQIIGPVNIVSGARVSTGKLGGFKEVLQKVGEGHPGSYVDKTHNRRTAKQVKTDAVYKKHKDKNK